MLGLVKAINRFDSARGERFLAYAGPTMTGEVKRHFRDHIALRPLLDRLPERERMILLYRFYGNKTQSEIAELMHLSHMHVSRLISRTLAVLKAELLEETA
jgi:DNA-directed RNA polymerase specialized sigma subunit